MRDLLEAKVASFEEMAGKLKALSEFKQHIAEDVEYPPKHPDRFRQKALEDKQEAIAALTVAHVLKVILAAKTKAEQIALMQHYVLEFEQSASRNAKLNSTLAADDPQKEEVEQDGLSDTLVVYVLNSILSDIAPEPSSPKSTAQLSVAARLGQVLSWTANVVALAVLAMFLVIASYGTGQGGAVLLCTAARF